MILIQNFITLFFSLIIESLPFVTLGVLLSVFVVIFVPESAFKKLPSNKLLLNFLISLLGVFFPVCQCGNIPISRRLILSKFKPSEAMVFLLAAPVVNPVTFITTWEAFPTMHVLAIWRIVTVLVAANILGFIMGRTKDENKYLTKQFYDLVCQTRETHSRSFSYALEVFQSEFLTVVRILCLGGLVAAGVQTIVPQSVITSIGHNIFLSVLAMMILGFVLSICSTVDAFFALAFATVFPIGAVFAFLIFAPLIDIKMVIMMRSIYTYKVIAGVSIAIGILAFLLGSFAGGFI